MSQDRRNYVGRGKRIEAAQEGLNRQQRTDGDFRQVRGGASLKSAWEVKQAACDN